MATRGFGCRLPTSKRFEVIADKIARILNGDPNYKDNWHDIQGYAKLAEDRCVHKPEEKIIYANVAECKAHFWTAAQVCMYCGLPPDKTGPFCAGKLQ